ncbi:hypothetical protein Ancab_021062 [Ancistrocladus abbreviatus]
MNHCAIQQNGIASSHQEMRNSVSSVTGSMSIMSDCKESVVCPKPRRIGFLNGTINDPSRPLRFHLSYQAELADSKAATELLDIILTKGGHSAERSSTQVASSPPFFCGSPPSRVSNPLIQDARFREEKFSVMSPLPSPIPAPTGSASSPTSSARKGGCVRANFGNNPAVRIEGFDCLDRDRRNCSIPALA